MNLNIEKYLYSIDQSFSEKSQRDITIIYAMVFLGLFSFSYLLFWEGAEAEYKEAKTLSSEVQKKINTDKRYLMINPESKITQIDRQIKAIESSTVAMRDSNDYIKYKIEQISELFYDEPAWGKYIDSISKNAKLYGVNIELLSNHIADDKNKFGHVLDINVIANGKFHQIVKFINSMEKSNLVIDIHEMRFFLDEENSKGVKISKKKIASSNSKLTINAKLSVWGIKY